MKRSYAALGQIARTLIILLLVTIGATALVRFAPGYLSDAREMDARYADTARAELSVAAGRDHSLAQMVSSEVIGWMRGDLGQSRQFEVPVRALLVPRLAVTGWLMLRAILLAWALALGAGLVSSLKRNPSMLWQVPATLLLAVPTAAMATLCLLAGDGSTAYPVLVMALLLAARDFKFIDRMLRSAWRDQHVLHARAQGMRTSRVLRAHILPGMLPQFLALATLSIVTALSAMVPIEVIFNVPGIGQMAWSAAMNRDLPVLLAVTMVNALAVVIAGMISGNSGQGTGPGQRADWQAA